MIIYFADRELNILGQASTELPKGMTITDDNKTEDIETGVAVFECTIPYDKSTRKSVETCTEVGNYLLRSHDDDNEFYTITEVEIDTKRQTVYLYAEDAGLDLLNEVVGAFSAQEAQPITYYINKYAAGSGFQIGINEAKNLTRKLSWDGEATAAERIASVATQFDGCDISYSFDIDGLLVTKKYINIYKKRGKDIGAQLRLNYDIDSIVTTKSIENLATALQCTGGTPENSETPITLKDYQYDDGDFYVSGSLLKSRTALKRWRRYLWRDEQTEQSEIGGHIVRQYSYDTLSQSTLCAHAVTELKKIRDMEVNYDVDIKNFPDNVRIGDRINIIDDAGELYLSTRILTLETSVANQTQKATLGEYLIQGSGIDQKVANLAAQFAVTAKETKKVQVVANTAAENVVIAQSTANEAQEMANQTFEKTTLTESVVQQLTDSIPLLITDENGTPLMEETETGWTFNTSKITNSLDDATNNLNTLKEEFNGTKETVQKINDTVSDIGTKTDYVNVGTYNNQPCVELGEKENNFKLRITNTEMQFADGEVIPAYINNQKLMIEQAEVKDELRFGNFIWKIRENGNMGLIWKESE